MVFKKKDNDGVRGHGHVGFYLGRDRDTGNIRVLGGNQKGGRYYRRGNR